MPKFAWEPIIQCLRNDHSTKPRSNGITMVIDTGLGIENCRDTLVHSGHLVDHWKFGFGTSVFVDREALKRKLKLLEDHSVLTFPGGTLLEVALVEHHCQVYMHHARELGFSAVEISDGTIPMPRFRRKKIIQCAIDAGLVPITEVGKKDPKKQISTTQLAEEALEDLSWGAKWVIVEGRESGVGVGVFEDDGEVMEEAVAIIESMMGNQVDQLIWEAPLKSQQTVLIEKFGTNVNFGNIQHDQVLSLEALRAGLRFETMHAVTDYLIDTGGWDPQEIEPPVEHVDSVSLKRVK
uniref:Phosphosulfolacetate synthase n=1 Tax=Alteromonadaceae bacterium PE-TB08W TaxID=1199097 RepID=A0A3G9DX55_9ALTE|nr:phosphosulfolacetate synthase [Alteromonadaceae bacterium PE-TB08W]